MKTKKQRVEEAEIRKNSYEGLTVAEKIDRLDVKLGKGVGAKKQRARLAKLLVKEAK